MISDTDDLELVTMAVVMMVLVLMALVLWSHLPQIVTLFSDAPLNSQNLRQQEG